MKLLRWFCVLVLAGVALGQTSTGGGQGSGSGAAAPSAPLSQVIQSGLLAEYRLTDGSGTAVKDSSSNANNAAFGTGTPSWIVAGGLNFGGNSNVNLPAALNTAQTMIFAINHDTFQVGNGTAILMSSSNSSVCTGLFMSHNQTPNTNWDMMESWNNGAFGSLSNIPVIGTGVYIAQFAGASGHDAYFLNGWPSDENGSSSATPLQTAGFWQLGGNNGVSCAGGGAYWNGNLYYAVFYNRVLSYGEVQQTTAFLQSVLANRGEITPNAGIGFAGAYGPSGDVLALEGDSEMNILAIPATTLFLNNAAASVYNNGVSGLTIENLAQAAPAEADPFMPAFGRGLLVIWAGTNDSGGSATTTNQYLARYCKDRRNKGWKVLVATMLSRTGGGGDTFKNAYNTLIRATWTQYADGIIDFASNAQVGADAAASNTNYFTDGLHTTTAAKDNILDWELQRAVNRIWGNRDFSTANTYTTGAAAATAITAASEATNTVTITSTLNPGAGSCVTITGVTPTGYNTSTPTTPPCWMVLTSSASTFTYFNIVSGLGAGSAFGTVSVPLQLDADQYVNLAGSAAGNPSFTLQSCQGYIGQNIYLKNANTTSAWVLTPTNSETIDGAATLTMPTASSGNFPVVILQGVLVSSSAANCNWKRIQ